MNHRIVLSTLFVCLSSTALGCETTGAVMDDAGGAPDTGMPGVDADVDTGPALATSLTYTPDGCSYTVTTPHAIDTARSRDAFGASATDPDHIHTSWAGPSDTTFAVNWHTGNDTFASSLLIGSDMAAIMAADGAATGVERHDGHYLRFSSSPTGANASMAHEVHVCGLTASTTYYYRVGGPGHWSDAFAFSTGPTIGSTEPFVFGVTGDSRGFEDNAWAITEHRMTADHPVDFEVFSGDAVVVGSNQPEWDQFFTQTEGSFSVQDFMASHALMVANGNHDLLTVNYLAQFALPQTVSPSEVGQGEDWYSFDYGNAHFVVLNDTVAGSTILGGDEAAWLSSDLAAVNRATTPWIFVIHHRPLYTCASTHAPDTALRASWQPIFDQYHVDFVLAGHNHEYERSAPIFQFDAGGGHVAPQGPNGAPVIDTNHLPSGTVYLVAAGAGAPLYPVDTSCPTTAEAQSVRNYVTFSITGTTLHMTAYDALTNAMIDELTYTK